MLENNDLIKIITEIRVTNFFQQCVGFITNKMEAPKILRMKHASTKKAQNAKFLEVIQVNRQD